MGRVTLLGDPRPPNPGGDHESTRGSSCRPVPTGDDSDAAAAVAAATASTGLPSSLASGLRGKTADGTPAEVIPDAVVVVVDEASRLGICAKSPSSVSCTGMCCSVFYKQNRRVLCRDVTTSGREDKGIPEVGRGVVQRERRARKTGMSRTIQYQVYVRHGSSC